MDRDDILLSTLIVASAVTMLSVVVLNYLDKKAFERECLAAGGHIVDIGIDGLCVENERAEG